MWFIVSYFSRLFVLLFCVDSVYHVLLKERVICAIMIEKERNMLAYVYKDKGNFALEEKPRPVITDPKDAIVKITLASICTSDLHIKHGFVPRAVKGVTVGHEAVGIVEEVGGEIHNVKAGDRVVVNVETFCGECFFCKRGYVNNCTDKNGGWAIGCRIDGVQAQYVKVPFANTGLTKIPDNVSDEEALFVGDILATGYWAADISGMEEGDVALIIGAGPTGICTALCAALKNPSRLIICEKDEKRREFAKHICPMAEVIAPESVEEYIKQNCIRGGADVVFEVAGAENTFELAWKCARPNAVVVVVAMYDKPQILPLPDMYGKNLTFKTGGVDGCKCNEILALISQKKIDATPLITHTFSLRDIKEAYDLFESRADGVIKVAVKP